MKKILFIFLILGIWFINCSTTPESVKNLANKPDFTNKNIVSIVVPHLSDPKEIAAFNAGVFASVGSEKLVPTVPEALKGTLLDIFGSASSGNPISSKIAEFVALAMKIVNVDYLYLISTQPATITNTILFIPRTSNGMEVNILLYDVKNNQLIGVAKYYDSIAELNPNLKLASITKIGKDAVNFLLEK